MKRQKIKGSSQIAEVGYDPEQLIMEIKFQKGGIYQYWPITTHGYHSLVDSKSVGSHFHKHIKSDPKIKYRKVDELQSDLT